MNRQELIAAAKRRCGGSVALQQALRSLGYSYQHVADFTGVSKRTAWQNCNGVFGCTPWEERLGKSELQEFARELVKNLEKLEKGEIQCEKAK